LQEAQHPFGGKDVMKLAVDAWAAAGMPDTDLNQQSRTDSEIQTIGKYEVRRKIAHGGFATVYEGWDPFIERRVAIKACTTTDAETRQRFQREARIAGNLDHPHIVRIFDFGTSEKSPYLIQEFLPGTDLDALIGKHHYLTFPEKLLILLQISRGLAYAHAHGVIHRDIKPANVRILEDGSVKLMDFGIATLQDTASRLTREGMTAGTVAYLAPEQIRGDGGSVRSDVFSFGVLAYELLSGSRPFDGETISAVLYQIVNDRPRALVDLRTEAPAELAQLIHCCLEKDPSRRWADGQALHTALERLRDDMPRAASSSPPRSSQHQRSPQSSAARLEDLRFEKAPPLRDPSGSIALARGQEPRAARWPLLLMLLLSVAGLAFWRGEVRGDLKLRHLISELRGATLRESDPKTPEAQRADQAQQAPEHVEPQPSTSPSRNVQIEQILDPKPHLPSVDPVGSVETQSVPEPPTPTPTPDLAPARIRLTGNWHPDLQLAINGGPTKRVALYGDTVLPAGRHKLTYSLRTPSYRSTRTITVRLNPGSSRTIECPIEPPGTVTIQAALGSRQGLARVDGEIIGETPVRGLHLAPGMHSVAVFFALPAPGSTQTTETTVRSSEETILTFDPGNEGEVTIRTRTLEPTDSVTSR
jgi:serine/threonine protein kinase